MDQESGEWNLNLINQVFFHEDATSILSIPLSRHKPKDCMIWAFTPRGRFTINSAYKVTRTITQPPTSIETSQSNEQARFWRHIRNLHIPNKIKNFTWKACNNILPTKANLYHRQVIDDPTCEARTLEPETVGHLF